MTETSSPFTPQQMQELAAARAAMRPIRRAYRSAQTDGWTLGVFGALSLICGISSASGVLVGAGLIAIAFIELRASKRLLQLHPDAARTMGWNQVALATLLVIYSVWSIHSPPDFLKDSLSSPELQAQGIDLSSYSAQVSSWVNWAVYIVYGILILVAIFGQGSLALYYFSRQKRIQNYLYSTPEWIVQMQKAGFSP